MCLRGSDAHYLKKLLCFSFQLRQNCNPISATTKTKTKSILQFIRGHGKYKTEKTDKINNSTFMIMF